MKLGVIFTVILIVIASAYYSANNALHQKIELSSLRLQMTEAELQQLFGAPYSRDNNRLTYVLDDASQLFITLRDEKVASAMVKYHKPLKIQDPQLRRLTLVQMNPGNIQDSAPTFFFAGKPEEGLIYKVTKDGEVESLTWVPPFTYGQHQAKNLQALLRDFRTQYLPNL
jgi:hypothetical protein